MMFDGKELSLPFLGLSQGGDCQKAGQQYAFQCHSVYEC